MKNLLSLSILLLLFSACHEITPNLDPQPEPTPTPVVPVNNEISPDSAFVALRAKLDFTSEPLTKAGSADDLYGFRVYQLIENKRDNVMDAYLAAYGTFDDISKAVIKMAKAYQYGIELTYIPNGKNLVHKFDDGHYGTPFDAVWGDNGALNQVMYVGTQDAIWPLSYGVVQEKGITDYKIQSNYWSSVTRYQGVAKCDPATESNVEVKLYSEMIGFRISITDFESGKVTIQGSYGHAYSTTPSSQKTGSIDIVVCKEQMPSFALMGVVRPNENIVEKIYEREARELVKLLYNDDNGNEATLYINPNFIVQRNTRYVMSFSLSDAIRNGGISPQVINEGDMNNASFPF